MRSHLALCLVLLLSTLAACQPKSGTPKTTQTPPADTEGTFAAQVLATLDGNPVTMGSLFRAPEVRRDLLNLRNLDIEMELIRSRFTQEGLTLDEEAYKAFVVSFLDRNGIEGDATRSALEVFEQDLLPQQNLDPTQWRRFSETQYMGEALVNHIEPVTEAEVQAMFDQTGPQPFLMSLGQRLGWTSPEQVTLEGVRPFIEDRLREQRISAFTTEWGKEVRESGKLTVNRLPSEPLPPAGDEAEGTPPVKAPAITEGWQPDPVAYVLNGTERTWNDILGQAFNRGETVRLLWIPVEQAVLEMLWSSSGQTLSEEELATERAKVIQSVGGEEAFREGLANNPASEEEMYTSIRRYVITKRLLRVEFPVTDAEVAAQFSELPPQAKQQLATQAGLDPAAEGSLELPALAATLRDLMEAERGGQNREAWLEDAMLKLEKEGRLKLVDERLKLVQPDATPLEITLPGPGGE